MSNNNIRERVGDRDMTALGLVGLADDRRGLDFRVDSREFGGMSIGPNDPLSIGFEGNKSAAVRGVTHDDKNVKIHEEHDVKLKFNPLANMIPFSGKDPIEYENRKTTTLKVGNETITETKEDEQGKFMVQLMKPLLSRGPFGFF